MHVEHLTLMPPPHSDSDLSSQVTKIFERPTEKDDTAKTVVTRETRAVKGDLMMERDLIKHMKARHPHF